MLVWLLPLLQAGIDRRVIINAVDINGKFKITGASNDILKTQKVDGLTVYDALELHLMLLVKLVY